MNCKLSRLSRHVFGLDVTHSWNVTKTELRLRPDIFSRGTGFSIVAKLNYRSTARAEAIYETYAGQLVDALTGSSKGLREAFRFVEELSDGLTVEVSVYGKGAKTFNKARALLAGVSPESIKVKFFHRPEDGGSADVELVAFAALGFMLIASGTVSAVDDEEVLKDAQSELEGSKFVVELTRYERSRINRAKCIAFHGTQCAACGFDFGEMYGSFADGFIEVHHVIPVSSYGGERHVCPESDLVPLCPNCHRVVHFFDPPLNVAALKLQLEQRRSL